MVSLFKRYAITRKERLIKAAVFGLGAAVLCTLLFLALWLASHFYSNFFYPLAGLAIGWAIQHFGRGVQISFSLMALALTLVCFAVCDFAILGFSIPSFLAAFPLDPYFLLWHAAGLALAFVTARFRSANNFFGRD